MTVMTSTSAYRPHLWMAGDLNAFFGFGTNILVNPLAHRPEQSPLGRALQCPLQIARSPVLDRSALAQLLEPPYTDPYVRWCGRGGAERLPPIPLPGPSRPNFSLGPDLSFRGEAEVGRAAESAVLR